MNQTKQKQETKMPKSLKDILAGVKKSTVVPGSTGDEPGVDYMPKAKGEQDFVALHKTEKHADRVGNGDDVYKGTTKYVLDKEDKHGHKTPKDKKVYDKGITEGSKCNMTEEGTSCPVHAEAACPTTGKTLREIRGKLKESLAVPLVGSADDESAEMAKSELRALSAKALALVANIPDSMTLEPWVQSKITKAKDYVSSVHDYMVYGDHEEQTAPYDGGIDMSSGTVRNTLPNFSADVNTGRNV